MLRHQGRTLYSASDLVNFMGCAHATVLDVGNLAAPRSFRGDDDSAVLLQEKGIEHERAYLERLRVQGLSIAEISDQGSLDERADATRAAMRQGFDIVYQGAFLDGAWHGYADFLVKVPGVPSGLGEYAYDVADTKLSRSAKPKHLLQLCVYAQFVAREQGRLPPQMHVVLGDGAIASLRTEAVIHYFAIARDRFERFAATPPRISQGDPCGHCTFCRWIGDCEAEWEAANHLSIVAGMGRSQLEALKAVGVEDIGALARLEAGARIPGIQPTTLAKLVAQARLQDHHRRTGERQVELLPLSEGRGFARLPRPDPGDLFFDMEGDPLFEGGLEYLFGIVAIDDGVEKFHEFWAHDRAAEKQAFEATMDFITARLARHPAAHVYHYAAYEENALKRLAMYHGTRESDVDDLLRHDKLVDLYKVVREAVRTSEPRYSIKNMEAFYLDGGRTGEVKTAGDSIVIYERWRRLGEPALLEDIARYNELDCRSTLHCRDWLLGMRPDGGEWFAGRDVGADDPKRVAARQEADARCRLLAEQLLAGGEVYTAWRRLLVDLLEFHRREAKPDWWAMFARQDMDHAELLDDAECIAGLTSDPTVPPRSDKRSLVYRFTFPAQDFKMRLGDEPLRSGTLEPAGEIVTIDEEAGVVELKLGPTRARLEDGCALIPKGPIGDAVLRAAVYRLADAVIAGDLDRYAALVAILRSDPPRLAGIASGAPVMAQGDATAGAIAALGLLDDSYLLVQGPPGAGKTYTSSQAIIALLGQGKRVAVASHSHKAINNLLREVEAMGTAQGLACRGIKKSSREEQQLASGGWISDTLDNGGVGAGHRLVAGVAWLFARPEHDQAFDYLFVDEAGQVGLANMVAMGVCARNIVLIGDQMQLSQPIKGSHPGGSGRSALEHLLGDHATVPPGQGIFLPETRRMHPDLCSFVSQAVYDGRLRAESSTQRQRLEVDIARDPEALAPAGLRFVEVDHLGCAQRSAEEVERLTRTYEALLGTPWTDRHGETRPIGIDDILVVSPYNMQVELLRRSLPQGARVGTVDKFQGQEAPVVLVSMATSTADDLPRNIEFLYSRNRLNVAISRARCLAVIYANPRLLEIPCNSIAQMELVDGLCWAKQFADDQRQSATC